MCRFMGEKTSDLLRILQSFCLEKRVQIIWGDIYHLAILNLIDM